MYTFYSFNDKYKENKIFKNLIYCVVDETKEKRCKLFFQLKTFGKLFV